MKFKFWEKEELPAKPVEVLKIVEVRGEKEPGKLTIDLQTYNEFGEIIGYPTITVVVPVLPRLRSTVNRVLAGIDTEDDWVLLQLYTVNYYNNHIK